MNRRGRGPRDPATKIGTHNGTATRSHRGAGRPDGGEEFPDPFVNSVSTAKHTRIVAIGYPFRGGAHTHGWRYEDRDRDPGPGTARCIGRTDDRVVRRWVAS